MKLKLICWNIGNPSIERATKQVQWLHKLNFDIMILTETKNSKGCRFIESYFIAYKFNVLFPKPLLNEYGTLIISKEPIIKSNYSKLCNYINSRTVSISYKFNNYDIEIIGTYIPSTGGGSRKIERKKKFIEMLSDNLKYNKNTNNTIFCGDLNIIEPDHIPKYKNFKDWEYNFYKLLVNDFKMLDTFKLFNKIIHHSWIGRTGNGYRYDHCFVSKNLEKIIKNCYYIDEPVNNKLSDHSAMLLFLK